MRILIIPDSFKEGLKAVEVSRAILKGVLKTLPMADVEEIPFSDGGEGALDVLKRYGNGKLINCQTENALGEKIRTKYFLFKNKNTAWIELSQASGLEQVPLRKRNILKASTYGTGLLIKDAIDKGSKEIILGVGGSATNDGGSGIFQALGGKLLSKKGVDIQKGGGALNKLEFIIPPKIPKEINWKVACDVNNTLLGNQGAANVYGPQKGANSVDIEMLEDNILRFSKIVQKHYHRDIINIEGGGAAGGTAAGMHGFFNATLTSGFKILSRMIGLESKIEKADLIFTAEGKLDEQSIQGKLTGSIARLARKYKIPVIGLAGSIKGPYDVFYASGFKGVFAIQTQPMDLSESIANTAPLITDTTSRVLNLYKK